MGLIRVILALSILLDHTGPLFGFSILNSIITVNCFFIISGFYIAFILNEKYIKKNSSVKLFLFNRFMRIYPLYWSILIIFLLFSVMKLVFNINFHDNAILHYFTFYEKHPSSFFIGDSVNFILRNLTLIVTTDYFISTNKVPGYLFVQQAWTLQIEALFYLIAPFILRKNPKVLIFIFLVIILLLYLFIFPKNIINKELLSYSFLKSLIFFILGYNAYLFYSKIKNIYIDKKYLIFAFLITFLLFIFFNFISKFITSYSKLIFEWFLYLVFTSTIPFIFRLTKKSLFDQKIANYSYPIFLSHFLIIKLFNNIALSYLNKNLIILITIIFTLCFSLFLVKFIEIPIDKFRHSFIKNR